MSLANRIKDARQNKRYTQRNLARWLNVKPVTVSAWEVGRNEPSLSMLKKLVSVLDVSFEYLAGVDSADDSKEKTLTENQKLVTYSIDSDISDEEHNDIIEIVKIAMKHRRRVLEIVNDQA